jgi:hypothetical protein
MISEINAQDFKAHRDKTRENAIRVHEEKTVVVHSHDDQVEIGRELCLPDPRSTPYIIYVEVPREYDYDLPPTDMFVGIRTHESDNQLRLYDVFGGGGIIMKSNIANAQIPVYYDPITDPDWVFWGIQSGWVHAFSPDGVTSQSIVNAYHLGYSGAGRLLDLAVVPSGHLLTWGRMETTSSHYASLRRWNWPDPPPSTANGANIFVAPGGLQGGSHGRMTVDHDRGMVYMCHGTRNGSAGVYRCSWDGSVSSILDSWSNGTSAPQHVPVAITYAPKHDMIYYVISSNSGGTPSVETYTLMGVSPDRDVFGPIVTLNPHIGGHHTVVALRYHPGHDLLYIATGEDGRQNKIEAYTVGGTFVGTALEISEAESIRSLHLTRLAA